MDTKASYTAVGLFVLVLTLALIGGVLWFASGGSLLRQYDYYVAIENESVAGLSLDAPITYQGVDVGKVREIKLNARNPQQVRLLLAIERGTPVNQETYAILRSQGLTGIVYVELRGGAPGAPPLRPGPGEEYPEIPTRPSLGARLEDVLSSVAANLQSVSANLNSLLDAENQALLKAALKDVALLAHTLAGRRQTLDRSIVAAAQTFEQSAKAAAELQPLLSELGATAESLSRMADEMAQASATAGETVAGVGANFNRLTSETLPEAERLLGELRGLTGSLRRLVNQAERNPSSLVFGQKPVPPGPGE